MRVTPTHSHADGVLLTSARLGSGASIDRSICCVDERNVHTANSIDRCRRPANEVRPEQIPPIDPHIDTSTCVSVTSSTSVDRSKLQLADRPARHVPPLARSTAQLHLVWKKCLRIELIECPNVPRAAQMPAPLVNTASLSLSVAGCGRVWLRAPPLRSHLFIFETTYFSVRSMKLAVARAVVPQPCAVLCWSVAGNRWTLHVHAHDSTCWRVYQRADESSAGNESGVVQELMITLYGLGFDERTV
jgi:hypothetical protein